MKKTLSLFAFLSLLFTLATPAFGETIKPGTAPLRVIKYIEVSTDANTTWNYLSDFSKLPEYAKMIQSVELNTSQAKSGSQVGVIRQCNITGMGATEERVVGYNAPHSYSYSAFVNPMGMTDHLATVELKPMGENKTLIVWKHYFNHPQPDMLAYQLSGMMTMIDSGLKQQLAAR